MTDIVALKKLETRLRTSTDLNEIKEIHDKAESLRLYVRKAGENLTLQNRYAEIKIRAERRCGELIPTKVQHGGNRKTPSRFAEKTLKSLGISKFQSHCWQSIAMMPDKAFEAHIAKVKDASRELTSIGVYRLSKEFARKFRRAAKLGTLTSAETLSENYSLFRSDFRNLKDSFKDIDVIITDPPYSKQYLGLYEDLAAFGKKVLKPGGSLLVMTGVAYLPEVLDLMKRHIPYRSGLVIGLCPDKEASACPAQSISAKIGAYSS
jgi:16S rRNA G966 N2-methylase RsmD